MARPRARIILPPLQDALSPTREGLLENGGVISTIASCVIAIFKSSSSSLRRPTTPHPPSRLARLILGALHIWRHLIGTHDLQTATCRRTTQIIPDTTEQLLHTKDPNKPSTSADAICILYANWTRHPKQTEQFLHAKDPNESSSPTLKTSVSSLYFFNSCTNIASIRSGYNNCHVSWPINFFL